jgi:FkbM family methyltransferase
MKICYGDKSVKVFSDSFYDEGAIGSLKRRCSQYHNDEPDTINWIKSFDSESVFYDIGSNIGGFSFIASMIHDNIKIFSFEPNFMSFYSQIKTCKENNISNIHPINIALNDENKFDFFKYDMLNNGAKGIFGEKLKKQILKSDYNSPFRRGVLLEIGLLGISLDNLVYNFGFNIPNYIKIDVDGNELLVLQGADNLLNEKQIKSVYIEIDDKIYNNNEIVKLMKSKFFTIKSDKNVGTKKKPIRMVLFERN